MNSDNNESGIILILTLFVLSISFVISLSFAAVYLKELQLSRAIVNSTIAFYSADAGIEQELFMDRQQGGLSEGGYGSPSGSPLDNNASYSFTIQGISPNRKVKATGEFNDNQRSIEITY